MNDADVEDLAIYQDPSLAHLTRDERKAFVSKMRRRIEVKRRIVDLAHADRCAKNYSRFVQSAWPVIYGARPLIWNWHLELGCDYMQAVKENQIQNLMMNWPPRMGKSNVVSIFYVPWVWATEPEHQFLHVSSRESLAVSHAVRSRNLMFSDWYMARFGTVFHFPASAQNKSDRYVNSAGGQRVSQSITGGIVGEDADCLIGSTIVHSEIGHIRLDALHKMKVKPRILSYNHRTGRAEFRRVIASRVMDADEIINFTTASGKRISATPRHRFYVDQQGYRAAGSIRLGQNFSEVVPELWGQEVTRKQNLSPLPVLPQKNSLSNILRVVWKGICSAAVEPQQKTERQSKAILLLRGALEGTSRHQKAASLRCLPKANGKEHQKVLLAEMQGLSLGWVGAQADQLPDVWENGECEFIKKAVLLKDLCRQSALRAHDWIREFTLSTWKKLCALVQENAPDNFSQRQYGLCGVRLGGGSQIDKLGRSENKTHQSYHPSHRRESSEQQSEQSGYALLGVPYRPSSLQGTKVEVAERLCGQNVQVYDIQVEGNGNFFANEILVHNSILIDDPNDPRRAESEKSRTKLNEETWEDLKQRLNDEMSGHKILIMQRIHFQDLAGHIIEHERDDWTIVCLPMEFESDHPFRCPKDPRKKDGELLFPVRAPADVVNKRRDKMNPFLYAGRFQQRPSLKGGNILMRSHFHVYEEWELPEFEIFIVSVDTAFKQGMENDYSAYTVWGLWKPNAKSKGYAMMLVSAKKWRPRYGILKEEAIELFKKYCKRGEDGIDRESIDHYIIEDKASGQSLIQDLQDAGIPAFAYNPGREDLEQRAHVASEALYDGHIWVPGKRLESGKRSALVLAPQAEMVVAEMEAFPKSDHDDITTTAVQAWSFAMDQGYIVLTTDMFDTRDDQIPLAPTGGNREAIYG